MKIFLLVSLALLSFFAEAKAQNPVLPISNETPPLPKKRIARQPFKESVKERLESYFYQNEIQPSIIINNVEGNQTDIELAGNKIQWIREEKETKIKINDDIFTLKDKKTLNYVEGEKRENMMLNLFIMTVSL